MRIVVTNKGQESVQELTSINKETKLAKKDKEIEESLKRSAELVKNEWKKIRKNKYKYNNNNSQSSIYFEEQEIQPEYKKEYQIHTKKLNLPKSIVEKYNVGNDFLNFNNIEDNLASSATKNLSLQKLNSQILSNNLNNTITSNKDLMLPKQIKQNSVNFNTLTKDANKYDSNVFSNYNLNNKQENTTSRNQINSSNIHNNNLIIQNTANDLHIYSNDTDELKSTIEDKSKGINIFSPRNKLSKEIYEQYNLNQIPKFKPTVELKRLISKKAFEKLEKKLDEKQYFHKVENLRRYKNQFREPIITIVEKKVVKQMLKKRIPIDYHDTIKYLKYKDTFSEYFIYKMTNVDQIKEKHYNKICQRVLISMRNEENQKEKIKQKVINNNNSIKEVLLKSIGKMDEISRHEEAIFQEYGHLGNKPKVMEMIIDRTDKIKDHWRKINVDRFFKPSKMKNNSIL